MTFRRSRTLKVKAGVDMTPLITVVFLLLLFFVVSSTFVVQSFINIRLATATGAVAYEQKDLSITLAQGPGGPDGKGPIYLNNVEVKDMGNLARALSEAHAEHPEIRVLIRPDAHIPSERLIEVLGIANSVGIERYGIAAQPAAVEAPK
jgi:biopolymer transport protein ExbD